MLNPNTIRPTNWLGTLVLTILLFVGVAFAATEVGYKGNNNELIPVSSSTPLPMAITSISSGAYTVSTLSVVLDGPTGFATDPVFFKDAKSTVSAPSRYAVNLSTSTPTLLSAIASWTVPCSLQIQCNNVAFYGPATTTAATVWADQRMAQYDTVWVSPTNAAFDLSFIASSSANASLSVLVWPVSY